MQLFLRPAPPDQQLVLSLTCGLDRDVCATMMYMYFRWKGLAFMRPRNVPVVFARGAPNDLAHMRRARARRVASALGMVQDATCNTKRRSSPSSLAHVCSPSTRLKTEKFCSMPAVEPGETTNRQSNGPSSPQ